MPASDDASDILFEFLFLGADDVIDLRDLSSLDIGFGKSLEVDESLIFIRRDEGDRSSGLACSTGPSHSMHIALRILREGMIDDVSDVIDVDTSRCDVRRD